MIKTYLYLNLFVCVVCVYINSHRDYLPYVYSFSPVCVSPTHVLATRRDWLASRGSRIECVRARNFPPLSLAISALLRRHPLAVSRLLRLSAINRKESKHRAPFALNDKRMDPDFSRQNYVILNARAHVSPRGAFTILNEGFYIFSRVLISA